jgi:hypothetical protein
MGRALIFSRIIKKAMKNRSSLDQINKAENVNQAISRDEEGEAINYSEAMQLAEDLILQLPASIEGRAEWLKRYGQSAEAKQLKNNR